MSKPFRATLWFKKGELDAAAASAAAESGDDLHPAALDLIPAEDRYFDDGTVTAADSEAYSLRTGGTCALPPVRDSRTDGGDVAGLVRDVTSLRVAPLVVGAAVSLACAVVIMLAC
jgi:hypothetical protein